jgi:hypothetical protein
VISEKKRAYNREYWERTRDVQLTRMRRWREANKEKLKADKRAWYDANKERAIRNSKAWRAANPEKTRVFRRRGRLKKRYKITEQHVQKLLKRQGYKCAICRTAFRGVPCVDHNHETGAIRGLLCDPCNLGLGSFKDDPVRLKAAAKYVSNVWLGFE